MASLIDFDAHILYLALVENHLSIIVLEEGTVQLDSGLPNIHSKIPMTVLYLNEVWRNDDGVLDRYYLDEWSNPDINIIKNLGITREQLNPYVVLDLKSELAEYFI